MTGGRVLRATAAAGLTLVAAGLVAERADAGGVAVEAPEELSAADCVQGERAPAFGAVTFPVEPTVVGCAHAPGHGVLVAADHDARGRRGFACFFTVPAGASDVDGACSQANPSSRYWSRVLTGGSSLEPDRIRSAPGTDVVILAGQASAGIESITVRHRLRNGRPERTAAALLRVRPRLARRLGAAGPFGYFVAGVQQSADFCAGVVLEALNGNGERVRTRIKRSRVFGSPVPLPGSDECAAENLADELSGAVHRMIEELALDLLRS